MELYLYWIIVLVSLLLSVRFLILIERKVLGRIQLRKRPNFRKFIGIFHSFSDAIKLFIKNFFYPNSSNFNIFFFSPILITFINYIIWSYYPFNIGIIILEIGIIVFIVFLRLRIYPFLISRWSSNSKYAIYGCIRNIAQVISYEVRLLVIILTISQICETFSVTNLVKFQYNYRNIFILFISFVILFLNLLAEINRIPFDFSERESELVSGFNVEFGGILFLLIFLAEYSRILLIRRLIITIFLYNSYNIIFSIIITLLIIILRSSMPRFRYDFLIIFSWKKILPLSLIFMIFMLIMKYC